MATGENSNALGWAMAVGGSAAGLGICGIAGGVVGAGEDGLRRLAWGERVRCCAGAKMMKKGEDEDDSDDGNSSEQGPLTE